MKKTRFGLHTTQGATDKLLKWEVWTGDRVAAVGELLSAGTWEDFSGQDSESSIAITLAAWEEASQKNEGESDQHDLLMEFSIPLFPVRPAPEEPLYEEIESRWSDGSEGQFNEHFHVLAETLVKKGWGSAHLRLAPEFNSDSKTSLWGIRDKSKNGPLFKVFWKQVHETMMSVEGADFKWVWSTALDGDQMEFNPFEAGWPGDDFVDVISVVVLDESKKLLLVAI